MFFKSKHILSLYSNVFSEKILFKSSWLNIFLNDDNFIKLKNNYNINKLFFDSISKISIQMISRIQETRKTQNTSYELNRNYRLLFVKLDQKHQNFNVHLIINLSIIVQLNERSSQFVIKFEIVNFSKISRSSILKTTHTITWLSDDYFIEWLNDF